MKTYYMGLLGLTALTVLTGCSRGVKGTYSCKGGIFLQAITLASDDKAHVTGNVFGSIQQKEGTYNVEADTVTITVGGQSKARTWTEES